MADRQISHLTHTRPGTTASSRIIAPPSAARRAVAGLTIEGGGRLSGPAINRASVASAAQQWRTQRPQIAVIDNFLSDEALAELRRFCWGSTVWRTNYERGYLGAVPEHGFASPLLAQIADEFRTVYADICGSHALKYLWAFKYDSTLDGVGIHADDAAVNVNFWITPDEANLDPERGGLIVWDVAAPLDWEYSGTMVIWPPRAISSSAPTPKR